MASILPVTAKLKLGPKGLLSRKTGGEKLFNVDDAGMVELKMNKFIENPDGGSPLNVLEITEKIGKKDKTKIAKVG